ncbi:MAG: hypothetical protein OXN17_21045 [Candidatus Poribacteria bacterium]|nr:hypothetical protein [Candidatus Poribacteria bacterium]MDE0503878.1 hypothetical protein [Candidatus Poribacteria bacterium]
MFPALLIVPPIVAAIISFCVVKVFEKPIAAILSRIIKDEVSRFFIKYVKLATYLVGISRGIRIFQLYEDMRKLNADNQDFDWIDILWMSGIYGTIIGTLQAIVHIYLWLFLLLSLLYIMVKVLESLEAKLK